MKSSFGQTKKFFTFKTSLGLLFALIVIFYGLYEVRNYLSGPELSVLTPANGAIVKDSLIEVSGETKRIAKIEVDGRRVFANTAGQFATPLLLGYGYNIIKVEVSDQFGRRITKVLEVTLN